MKEQSLLQYHATGIAGLLRTEQLAVPFYQRSYSWHVDGYEKSDAGTSGDKSQVDDFWNDLIRGFFEKRSYFLGTIVLANDDDEGGRKVVIDGQQRLATASILIACIRDELRDRGEDEFANSTQTDYIGKFDRQVGSSQPKLILNSDDRDYYNRAILNGDWKKTKAVNLSQNLLSDAYTFLTLKTREFVADQGSSWRDRLVSLLTYLDESVQVVAIDVGTQADAFLIFETLNDRGADLTVADLLKNYLFSQAGARLDEVRDAWVTTLGNLNIEKVGNQRFTTFARHLMSSKHGRTRERELYGKIRSSYSGAASVVTFSQELKDSSKLYDALLTADSDYWGDFDERTRSAVEVLGILNLEQYRPLLLAAMSSFEKNEIKRFLISMVNWSVRALVPHQATLGR